MSLTKPNQELHRDLKEVAAVLKWSGVDLFTASKRLLDAGDEIGAAELVKIAVSYQAIEERMDSYAGEVKVGQIKRNTEQS